MIFLGYFNLSTFLRFFKSKILWTTALSGNLHRRTQAISVDYSHMEFPLIWSKERILLNNSSQLHYWLLFTSESSHMLIKYPSFVLLFLDFILFGWDFWLNDSDMPIHCCYIHLHLSFYLWRQVLINSF
jgi:hypothetical protein